jgi:hypothetical protein
MALAEVLQAAHQLSVEEQETLVAALRRRLAGFRRQDSGSGEGRMRQVITAENDLLGSVRYEREEDLLSPVAESWDAEG